MERRAFIIAIAIGVGASGAGACSPTPAHRTSGPTASDGGRSNDAGGGVGGSGGAAEAGAVSCGDAEPWMSGAEYKGGKVVTNGTPPHRYECKPFPFEGWCRIGAYEPGKLGAPWMDAWIDLGACP